MTLNALIADLSELVATIAATMRHLDPDASGLWEVRENNAKQIQKRALNATHHPTMGDLQGLYAQVNDLAVQGSAVEVLSMAILTAAAAIDSRISSFKPEILSSTPTEDVAVALHLYNAIQNLPHSAFGSDSEDDD